MIQLARGFYYEVLVINLLWEFCKFIFWSNSSFGRPGRITGRRVPMVRRWLWRSTITCSWTLGSWIESLASMLSSSSKPRLFSEVPTFPALVDRMINNGAIVWGVVVLEVIEDHLIELGEASLRKDPSLFDLHVERLFGWFSKRHLASSIHPYLFTPGGSRMLGLLAHSGLSLVSSLHLPRAAPICSISEVGSHPALQTIHPPIVFTLRNFETSIDEMLSM